MKKVTQKDIASRVGVSCQLVSIVLNNSSDIPRCRPELTKKIIKVANELNYRPSRVAKQMKHRRTGGIGILMKNVAHVEHDLLQALLSEAKKNDYMISLEQVKDDKPNDVVIINEEVVDGIIVFADINQETLNQMDNIHEPILFYNTYKQTGTDVITCDDFQGGALAASKLIEANRKKIVYLTYDSPTHPSLKQRKEGIEGECKKNNVEFIGEICCKKSAQYYSEELAPEIAEKLKNIDFDGVVLYSDMLGTHFYEAMKILGKSIPKDCSVISFNNSGLAQFIRPRLTSLYIPYETIGSTIINKVVELIKQENQTEIPSLQYKVAEWDSV